MSGGTLQIKKLICLTCRPWGMDFVMTRTFTPLFLSDSGLQQLKVGFWYPARDWGRVTAARALNPNHQTSDQWQGPGSSALQRRIPTKMQSRETSTVFIRGEKVQYMRTDTWEDSERESLWVAPSWQFELLLWGISSGFPLAVILIWLVLRLYLVYLRSLPYVHVHLLAKMDSSKETYRHLTSLTMKWRPLPLWPPRSLSVHM